MDPLAGVDVATLLGPLCDAADALARLDARAAAAPDAIRDGLIARMAFTEAAGWLAHAHAWVHPLDLALRDLDLTGSTALAATGGGHRVLPHTFATGNRSASGHTWGDRTFDAVAEGDRAVADALAFARLLRRLPGIGPRDPFGSCAAAEAVLAPFGAGPLNPIRFAAWREAFPPATQTPNRRPTRAGKGASPGLPPLLSAARAAEVWMESGIAKIPTPMQAMLAAVYLLARTGPARAVFVPVWAGYPIVGHGDPDTLPRLRSDVADRVVGWAREVAWPVAFLHLVAEGAWTGLRELDRLLAIAEQGASQLSRCDRRSRLPDALDAALCTPALTPKALAARLHIAPQTATTLLRDLRTAGLVREVTGRRSFRAFAA
jgi:hypothetical protein